MTTTIFDAVRVDVRVPADLRARLDEAARRSNVSRSAMARAILSQALRPDDPKAGR